MLTPQEVSERSFSKASFGGYNMAMVDDFLDVLTADYTALYNENAVLKSKMKVLVDKVEEYRSTEEAMRKALLSAQRFADEMVAEAKNKKEEMLRQAEEECAQRARELKQQLSDEEARLEAAKSATADFVAAVKRELSKEVDFLGKLEEISAPAKREDPVKTTAIDIEETLQQIVAKEMEQARAASPSQPAAPAEEPDDMEDTVDYSELFRTPADKAGEAAAPAAPEEDEQEDKAEAPLEEEREPQPTTRSRVDFSNLQFGDNYEIK